MSNPPFDWAAAYARAKQCTQGVALGEEEARLVSAALVSILERRYSQKELERAFVFKQAGQPPV